MRSLWLTIFVITFILTLSYQSIMSSGAMAGGFRSSTELSSEEHDLLRSMQQAVETKLGKGPFTTFTGLASTTQVVAGINYLFKVQIDNDEIIHVKVHKPLPHTHQDPFVLSVEEGKTLQSSLP